MPCCHEETPKLYLDKYHATVTRVGIINPIELRKFSGQVEYFDHVQMPQRVDY